MNYRVVLIICVLLSVFAVGMVMAEGAVSDTSAVATKAVAVDTAAVPKAAAVGVDTAAIPKAVVGVDTSAVVKADTVAADTAAAPKGLDIDALLADDDGDDLLADYKPVVAKDSAAADSSAVSGAAGTEQLSADEKDSADDDAGAAVQADAVVGEDGAPVHAGPGRRGPPPAVLSAPPVAAGPVVVEDGRTINFAQNLKEYRSPRLAMIMSLFVPGLGQAYSRSYVKAGAFGAAEIAAIGVAVYLNSVGKSKKSEAHKFADEHFDIRQLEAYDIKLRQEFQRRIDLPEGDSARILDWLYFPPYDDDFYDAAKNRQTYFYESIRGTFFTPGWIDNEPSLSEILNAFDNDPEAVFTAGDGSQYMLYNTATISAFPDHFYRITRILDAAGKKVFEGPLLGHSNYQAKYDSMVRDANSYHAAVNYTLYALLINHIASAIDAGFTARAYNARLLGNDNSVWNRLSVDPHYVFSGSDVSSGLALRVRF